MSLKVCLRVRGRLLRRELRGERRASLIDVFQGSTALNVRKERPYLAFVSAAGLAPHPAMQSRRARSRRDIPAARLKSLFMSQRRSST
jgi:hypothetical protein